MDANDGTDGGNHVLRLRYKIDFHASITRTVAVVLFSRR